MTLLITGAAGAIGTRLAADLATHGIPLRLLDRRHPDVGAPAGVEFVQAHLRDLDATEKAAAGISAIVHLAGITQERPFADMVEHHITGTHHVLEAARRQRVPRVVLASSHHVPGLNPVDGPAPLAPDSFYAVSKVTAEALGHLYAHKTDVQVVAVRIGSYRDRPTEPRHRATWLSPRDATALLRRHPAPDRPVPHRVRHFRQPRVVVAAHRLGRPRLPAGRQRRPAPRLRAAGRPLHGRRLRRRRTLYVGA
ncbi:NAD-dependent epimerase/dehydratase family protein [Streptomyces sp. NPDC056160]|uniref:NAD-dependent epimerase/dehydratase family protein n=1 Tax=Streptomyces sp. NPDC056160 TaxID=3345731 RepID=UPI0035E2F24A